MKAFNLHPQKIKTPSYEISAIVVGVRGFRCIQEIQIQPHVGVGGCEKTHGK